MFGRTRANAAHLAALERIEQWTRARFALGDNAVVLVSELECGLPGCPPLETVIAFWTGAEETRYRIKIFKCAAEVAESDLPVRWLMRAYVDTGDLDCC